MPAKTFFKIVSILILLVAASLSFFGSPYEGNTTLLVAFVILAFFAYSWGWTYTPDGRLDYRTALSLLLTFNVTIKPDPAMDFKIRLPINMFFTLSMLFPKDKIERSEDITISRDGLDVPARVYYPVSIEAGKPPPLVVYYHGGGFVLGSVAMFDALARSLVKATQAILVSVDYRLAPKYGFPAATDDAYAALQWAAENAARLGADPECLMVAGDSAGGNLAAVVAMRARDEGGPDLAAQLLYYPACDLSNGEGRDWASKMKFQNGYGFTTEALRTFRNAYCGHVEDDTNVQLSPVKASRFDGLPRTLLVTAGFDPLTETCNTYSQHLQEAGVEVMHHHYPDTIHGFLSANMLKQRDDTLRKTNAFVKDILR